MHNRSRKIISGAVIASMVLSCAGCSLFDKSKDEVKEAAESYAEALAKHKGKDILALSDEDTNEDYGDYLKDYLDFSAGEYYDSDTAAVVSAIADTITYEIDEESVDASKKNGEGSIDVTFTMVDYEAIINDDDLMADLDTTLSAIEDSEEMIEVPVSIDFELDDEEWLVTNYSEIADELYAFTEIEISYFNIADYVTGVTWYGSDDYEGTYTNTTSVDMDLSFSNYSVDYSGVYYTVESNGTLLYTSDRGTYEGYFTESRGATLENGYIAPGSYTITFYDEKDREIISGVATVLYEEVVATTSTSGNGTVSYTYGDDFYSCYIYDSDSFSNSINYEGYNIGDPAIYLCVRTWAYYGPTDVVNYSVYKDGTLVEESTFNFVTSSDDHIYITYAPANGLEEGIYTFYISNVNADTELTVVDVSVAFQAFTYSNTSSDFYSCYIYSDDNFSTTVSSYSAGDDGIYLGPRTWAYYGPTDVVNYTIELDGAVVNEGTFNFVENSDDHIYIVYEPAGGLVAGNYTITITDVNTTTTFAVVSINVI